jgi:hypothetical protein
MLIGILGAIGAGKSTFASYLQTNDVKYKRVSFADSLKDECSRLIDPVEIGWNGVDYTGKKTDKGRKLLQDYGYSKRQEYKDYWIIKLMRKLSSNPKDVTICDDLRHINEIQYFLDLNGIILYIRRKSAEDTYIRDYIDKGKYIPSEVEWRTWVSTNHNNVMEVDNNYDLAHLRSSAEIFHLAYGQENLLTDTPVSM